MSDRVQALDDGLDQVIDKVIYDATHNTLAFTEDYRKQILSFLASQGLGWAEELDSKWREMRDTRTGEKLYPVKFVPLEEVKDADKN